MKTIIAIIAILLVACGHSEQECKDQHAKCDRIASDIRNAAALRGLNSAGICSSANPQVQKDFGQACNDLKACNDDIQEVCE